LSQAAGTVRKEGIMTVEVAIRTAMEYEAKVRDTYAAEVVLATDPVAVRVLTLLAREEQGHLDYLVDRMREWTESGTVKLEKLGTQVPSAQLLAKGIKGLERRMAMTDEQRASALATLRKAEAAERATAQWYHKVVDELPGATEKALFSRFLEIEEGHAAIVQAEIDSVTGLGFWFDVPEFRLESE
jgi:rubrerythrin